MKRTCLLSRSYTGAPMMLAGRELHYSPLVNEIMGELKNSVFHGPNPLQTEHNGMAECIMIMFHMANNSRDLVHQHMNLAPEERIREVVKFYLDHEEEIDAIRPLITERIRCAMAAAVESEVAGKSLPPPPDSSPS